MHSCRTELFLDFKQLFKSCLSHKLVHTGTKKVVFKHTHLLSTPNFVAFFWIHFHLFIYLSIPIPSFELLVYDYASWRRPIAINDLERTIHSVNIIKKRGPRRLEIPVRSQLRSAYRLQNHFRSGLCKEALTKKLILHSRREFRNWPHWSMWTFCKMVS